MDKQLEEARRLLKDRNRETIINHLNSLSDDKQIKFLKKTTIAYKAGLKPRELNPLIDIFKQFKTIAKRDPSRLEIKLLGIIDEHNTGPVDKEKLKNELEKTFNIEEGRIISMDTRSTSADLLKCINHINAKCDFISNIDLYLKELSEKRLEKDWEKRIEKLEALQELYPIKENISEIFKTTSNASKLDMASDWMDPLVKEIVSIKITDSKKADKKVTNILKNEYSDFIKEFDFTSLKTPFVSGGTRTKKSIALALIFIYSKRNEKEIKDYSTVTKHYKKLNLWN